MKIGNLTIKKGSEYYSTLPNMWAIGWRNTTHHGYFWMCLRCAIEDMCKRR